MLTPPEQAWSALKALAILAHLLLRRIVGGGGGVAKEEEVGVDCNVVGSEQLQ